jgi:hypothetical protein
MKITLSTRFFAIFRVLALLAVNTYLIFDLRGVVEDAAHDSMYDYVIYRDGAIYKAKNRASGYIDFSSTSKDATVNVSVYGITA